MSTEKDAFMLPLEITPATIAVGLVIIALAALATHRLARRGSCDCHDHGAAASKAPGGCAGCAGCGAADRMLAAMERAAK